MNATTIVESQVRPATGAGFKTTQWHLIRQAGQPEARGALEALCQAYWYPIYAVMRGEGQNRESAQDLTQGFFASLFERADFASLDPARGTFRSWLRKSAMNFFFNDLKKQRALRRGGGTDHVSIDVQDADERFRVALTDETLTPDQQFDRSWALTVLARAMSSLEAEYEQEGAAELFNSLRGTLSGEEPSVSTADLAAASGKTTGAVKTDRCRRKAELQKRYRSALRAQIAATVNGPRAVDAELRDLLHALSL